MQIRNGDKELKKRLMLETILRDAPTHSCIDYCRKKITVSLRKLKGNKKNPDHQNLVIYHRPDSSRFVVRVGVWMEENRRKRGETKSVSKATNVWSR